MDTENTILKQIQQNLDALQKQIDNMKPAEDTAASALPAGAARALLNEKAHELLQMMRNIINTGSQGAFVSAVFSANGSEYENLSDFLFYFSENPEIIDENAAASVIDAFSSPKRINILKALLAKKNLSSNELTLKTGCIGGQLYHHLSILEGAKIVCKQNELYAFTEYGKNMTNIILCSVFGKNPL